MLYATDRKPSDASHERPFYLNEPGFIVRLGRAGVKAGPAGTDWEAVRRISLAKNRAGNYPLEILSVRETGAQPSTYSFLTRLPPGSTAPDEGERNLPTLSISGWLLPVSMMSMSTFTAFGRCSMFPCWSPPSSGASSATRVPSRTRFWA